MTLSPIATSDAAGAVMPAPGRSSARSRGRRRRWSAGRVASMASRTKVIPRLVSMLVISAVASITSPGCTGAGHSKVCSPWISPARSMPTSGIAEQLRERRAEAVHGRERGRHRVGFTDRVGACDRLGHGTSRFGGDPLTRRRVAPADVALIRHRSQRSSARQTPQPHPLPSEIDIRINYSRIEPYTRTAPPSKAPSRCARGGSPPRRGPPSCARSPSRMGGAGREDRHRAARARCRIASATTGIASPPPASSLIATPGPSGRATAAQTPAPPIFAVSRSPATSSSAVSNRFESRRQGTGAPPSRPGRA